MRPHALPLLAALFACRPPSPEPSDPGPPPGGDGGGGDAGGGDGGSGDGGDPGNEDPTSPLVLNEACASNRGLIMDPHGDLDDWVEILHRGDAPVSLDGWGLGQGDDAAAMWSFPTGLTLNPGERLLVWLDDEADEGPLHASFKLSATGETLRLFAPGANGAWLADAVDVPALRPDTVYGRFPDGGDWSRSVWETPGAPNPAWPGSEEDPSDRMFRTDSVLSIEISLSDAGWVSLNNDPYTWVEASVGVGGAWYDTVGLRIKGQWGSLRNLDQKAAFRVDLDRYVSGQEHRGLGSFTLNNMVQDRSYFHERTAYRLMRALGTPAPRTAYAAVWLNGEYRGLYLFVESPDERFLARWFDDPDGNLYEGEYGQDLTWDHLSSLDQDEQGADGVTDRSDLAALAEVLAGGPNPARVDDFRARVDVERTAGTFAAEVLTGHWDGYFYYPNNWRAYHEPDTGRFTVLAWGMDQTFGWNGDPWSPSGAVAQWMVAVPELRTEYNASLLRTADALSALDIREDGAAVEALILPWVEAETYREGGVEEVVPGIEWTAGFAADWSAWVRAAVEAEGDEGDED